MLTAFAALAGPSSTATHEAEAQTERVRPLSPSSGLWLLTPQNFPEEILGSPA